MRRIIIKRQGPFMEEIFRERERKERKQRQKAEKEDNIII